MKNKIIVFVFGVIAFYNVFSQQDALYSQYMFNPLVINPAYAGTRNTVSGVMLYRNQWVGINGAPKTVSMAVHSPIKGKNFALGLNLLAESIGPTNNSTFLGTYAYHLNLGKGKISFALRGGLYSFQLRNNELNYTNNLGKDPVVYNSLVPNFDFGTYYHTDKFYAGFSANHLTNGKVSFSNNIETYDLNLHLMGFIGKAFVLSPNLVIKPSGMLKFSESAPLNYDINTSVLMQKVLWVGASYRSSFSELNEASLVFITEYNISDSFRLGYSYDFNLGDIKRYNSGSHEVFLGVDLYSKRKQSVSPRYL
ncbi:MAG: type IX secretion system membrane protein PorP/SprF [Flavobacteriales bacterium]|jgi:type IX secretion system PorP/SprF family membrane protein|nr:type IX secretion system membrane protein PorP/SprF [Flavobacteriales bacterium]